ncbi:MULTISPECIES: MarR family winged helix-turn-helix transcriptional regulator [Microbacterium]|jgi:DNA-binding MarR family transcriptional regulator|uniref:MarR family winged helix-turn-helix transcriptional regulator n=1 Tax=Microbacterium TaxID=33882 RepID=UPI000B2A620D|nr:MULTISPECIES: MarR family transcriptional regulator [Microbacterium]AZS47579.1 Organic hydroperoxide resistance transcriptional regulator [Microbacterium oxydans]WKT89110.1 MarR family transcriptional regulator [Microbacterium liquefaciens]
MPVTDEMVCFSLYSAARATTQAYRALLAPWGLTYPQYLVLAILWHEGDQTIGSLGDAMQLDSGTLSPLVRRLEQAGLVAKTRSPQDERVVTVQLTSAGQALRGDLAKIPAQIAQLSGIRDDAHRRRLIAELHELTALLQSGVSTPATGATALRAGE